MKTMLIMTEKEIANARRRATARHWSERAKYGPAFAAAQARAEAANYEKLADVCKRDGDEPLAAYYHDEAEFYNKLANEAGG